MLDARGTGPFEARGHRFLACIFLVVAALLPLFTLTDRLALGHTVWAALGLRLVGSVFLVTLAKALWNAPPHTQSHYVRFGAWGCTLLFLGLCWMTGGAHSYLFPWTLALSPALAAVFLDDPIAVAAGSVLGTAGGLGVLVLDGIFGPALVLWGTLYLSSMAVSAFSVWTYSKLRIRGRVLAQARAEAQQHLEEARRRSVAAERLAVVGQLAAGVAHEISQPLSLLSLQLPLLRRELQVLNPAAHPVLDRVTVLERGVGRIRSTLDDLKRVWQPQEREPEWCALGEVVEEVLRLGKLRISAHVRVERALEPGLPKLYTLRRQLAQVLLNLLINAVDALEASGRTDGWVRIGARRHGDTLRIFVEDNGPGIPPQVLEHLFEPFVTTKPEGKGTGLGLALSREYVQLMGGELVGENLLAGGARFTLVLPQVLNPEPPAVPLPNEPTPLH